MAYISVAVDGPAGAGKSTVSRECARELGFVYIDTGAMYRTVALYAIENGLDGEELVKHLDDIGIDIEYSSESGQLIYLNGTDVSGRIRSEDVSARASDVSAIREVRKRLVDMQRAMAQRADVIMDGRDIGTCVLPNATVKVFLTASSECRALRRCKELRERGEEHDFATVKAEIERRDENDSTREESPLRRAEDAVLLDTSAMTFDESVSALKGIITEKTL